MQVLLGPLFAWCIDSRLNLNVSEKLLGFCSTTTSATWMTEALSSRSLQAKKGKDVVTLHGNPLWHVGGGVDCGGTASNKRVVSVSCQYIENKGWTFFKNPP